MRLNPLQVPRLYVRSRRSSRYGAQRQIPGLAFDRFGRAVGRRLLLTGYPYGITYFLTPVYSTRYFEFQFALDHLPPTPGDAMDVSSPNLFGLYVAAHGLMRHTLVMNPDAPDLARTCAIARRLRLATLTTQPGAVDALAAQPARYDCLWSLSVVEHIAGAYDDRTAVRLMYAALRPGGRLILTVPVDRTVHDEYRTTADYSTQEQADSAYFFQRFYDEAAIQERLVASIGVAPIVQRWFGEREAGHGAAYVEAWRQHGFAHTTEDAREIADHYQDYSTFASMPGGGVCGLVFDRPRA